ncbi:MAG TPA: type II toxin-antitoxin system VapB family antitoxin [Xanthobacteraceae bacterium]|nr:type II toxin-antitoxin system VapB family antitoxin [Xanthobacteraceae bacterium]
MKVTVEIHDALLREVRQLAAGESTTLRALVEEGLRRVIAARRQPPFRLRPASFRGEGLQPDVANKSWDEIRRLSYGD